MFQGRSMNKINTYGPLLRNLQMLYPEYKFEIKPSVVDALGSLLKCLAQYLRQLGFNLAQDGPFWGCSGIGVGQKVHPPPTSIVPKICPTYHTMMKLETVIPCLKEIHKTHRSGDTPFEFC